MEMKYLKLIKDKLVLVGIGVLVLSFLMWNFFKEDEISFADLDVTSQLEVELTSQEEGTTQVSLIYVDIKGQVKSPGVYQVTNGARVIDAIKLAGGLTQEADANQVNQAQLLADQMVIYIPKVGEEMASGGESLNQVGIGASSQPENVKINLNQADLNDLMTLPNIGPKKAEAIIRHREENGSFQAIEDLIQVSGIGQKTFEGLSDLVVVE